MSAHLMNGKSLAATIHGELSGRVAALAAQGVVPGLGTLLVGDDGPSANYVAMKHRDCEALGISSVSHRLPATATQAELEAVIDEFNVRDDVHAALLQYPFPKGLDYESAILRLRPEKDADGLHPVNLGKLVMGEEAPLPCTPHGILRMLAHYEVPVEGRHVVIIGRGLTIGRPLANLLTLKRPGANAAVTVVHTGVADLAEHTRRADVIVAAAGAPGLVTAEMVRPGAAVVAAGVSFRDGRLLSDVADEVAEVAGWLSPRIGGVGPMTRAMLMENTVLAAERTARRGAAL